MSDSRNVIDEFKDMPIEEIVKILDKRGVKLEIAIENQLRDFNMGSIVRSANAFGVRRVHIVGSKQWNKRGAMMTDKYLHIVYHSSAIELRKAVGKRPIIGVDNVEQSQPLHESVLPENAILVFGAEGPGLSEELIQVADSVVAIEQYGSTRSLNVGVAAGIVMYEWTRRHLH